MDWQQIEARLNALLINERHNELRGALMMLNPVDIAQYLSGLETDKLLKVFRILPKSISADVFSYMNDEQRQKLLSSIGDQEIRDLVSDMFIDDAVDFLEELPAALVKRVLATVGEDQRKLINRFLSYPDNSAGSIMTIEYCAFITGTTVKEAMLELKRTGLDKETIYTLYIVDAADRLMGTLPLRRLIMAGDDAAVDALMDVNFISTGTLDDQEAVAELVRKYDLMAVPVTDKEGRLVGIVTVDDIMDVMQDEATEDMEKMSALVPAEDEYMKTGVWKLSKNRLPWLMLMMLGSILTGVIISSYEGFLVALPSVGVALTACIPMLMDTGGNCGSQSSTLVIRGLAVGEISPRDALTVLWKELRVALMVSFVLAATNYLIQALLFARGWMVSVTVSLAMVATVILSKAIGCLLPLAAKSLHLDPALTATPLITTIVDACSLMILFTTASALLG